MLPTPELLKANRTGSALAAVLTAGLCAGFGWLLEPEGAAPAMAAGAGVALGAGVYWLSTARWRRRARILRRPFPEAWRKILEEKVAYYAALPPDQQRRFREMAAVFLAEKPVTGVKLVVDDVTRVLVAASAVIPVLNLPGWEYGMLREVLVFPDYIDQAVQTEDEGPIDPDEEDMMGMVGESGTAFSGLLMLSKPDLLYGFSKQSPRYELENVGIHEFAHLIDGANGFIDGLPPGLSRGALDQWLSAVRAELDRPKKRSGIPEYGYSDEDEFFATALESFFTRPAKMASRHPELYALLVQALRQDPKSVLGKK